MRKSKRRKQERKAAEEKIADNKPKNRNLGLLVGAGALALTALAGSAVLYYNSRIANPSKTQLEEKLKQETGSFDISKYGNVVYSYNEGALNQLYIIGNMHIVENNGNYIIPQNVTRTQLEAYRIAQQLISYKSVQLYLPESITLGENVPRKTPDKTLSDMLTLPDEKLEEVLRNFLPLDVNLLLQITYPTLDIKGAESNSAGELQDRVSQVPNEQLYSAMPLVRYVAKLRSGYLLMNATGVIEDEFKKEKINNRNAMIIIGNSHIVDFIDFIKNGRINVSSQNIGNEKIPGLDVALNLKESDYGVTIIRPLSIK